VILTAPPSDEREVHDPTAPTGVQTVVEPPVGHPVIPSPDTPGTESGA
jgi:hypothetical protein